MDQLTRTLLARLRAKHLRAIEVLGRAESMHAAAIELNMTQPAVTKMLRDVEDVLGLKLFERRSTGISPTLMGRTVIDFARRTVSDIERFAGVVSNMKLGGYGSLSIGVLMVSMPDLVPRAIKELKARRPLMTIHLVAATSDILLDALKNHTIDLAVARLTSPQQNAAFHFQPLLDEAIWLFSGTDNPLAAREEIQLSELYTEPWVLQTPMSPLRQMLQQCFADCGIDALPNWIETTSIYSTLKLVRDSGLISALPRTIVEEEVKSGELARLNVNLPRQLGAYGIVTRRGEPVNENVANFAAILSEIAAGMEDCDAV